MQSWLARTLAFFVLFITLQGQDPRTETIPLSGLQKRVEVLRDPWGVSHIFAETEPDLFFAQGYCAARDRLFQLEVWRRSATGTISEILGERALEQDTGARLLKFRGNLAQELNHYHPRGAEIVESFVRGINAYVDQANENPGLLPLEFRLLGTRPGRWTEEVVVSRHNGLFRNATFEVELARLLAFLGVEKASELLDLEPGPKKLQLPDGLDPSALGDSILKIYRASRAAFSPLPEDIVDPSWRSEKPVENPSAQAGPGWAQLASLGSNNWVLSGSRTITGHPFMANDPHRALQVPSLRYFVHLVGPGWNVIGGGEPALPGISIGHNQQGAWGLTIFAIDQEDLYFYETEPGNPLRYRYGNGWEEMEEIAETISVKGGKEVPVRLRHTRHGPVVHEDFVNHRAYALRAAWLEKGASPYLASLRFNQSDSWKAFREACDFFLAPSENMVWADREGNIGWQAVGISPIRPNWDGLLPVPGDGRFEWNGFLPGGALPSVLNPPEGFWATANQENLPRGFPHGVGFLWSEPFRYARISEFLASGRLFALADMVSLQQDFLSLPARWLVPMVTRLRASDESMEKALRLLKDWDLVLTADSPAAAIYVVWERELISRAWSQRLPEEMREKFSRKQLRKTIDWLQSPGAEFGDDPTKGRDTLLLESLGAALADLNQRFGPNMESWKWGDAKMHHTQIQHLLSSAVKDDRKQLLDIGPVPRGGNGSTVNVTGNGDNQTSGASFRVIIDLEDWDRSLATNFPGQSGNPEAPHYRDLVESWATGQYFPLLYSRSKIESVAESRTILMPAR